MSDLRDRLLDAVAHAWDATDLSRDQSIDHITRAVLGVVEPEIRRREAQALRAAADEVDPDMAARLRARVHEIEAP